MEWIDQKASWRPLEYPCIVPTIGPYNVHVAVQFQNSAKHCSLRGEMAGWTNPAG